MGAIGKFVKNTAGRAIDAVQTVGDNFTAVINRVQGYVGTAFEVAKNGETFVGINQSEVGNIRGAIKTYVNNIQTELDKLNTEASNDNAIKGETAKAAKDYVMAVSKVSQAYVSALKAYSDKMYEYAEAYASKESELASSVSDEATALSSSAEEYQEKY